MAISLPELVVATINPTGEQLDIRIVLETARSFYRQRCHDLFAALLNIRIELFNRIVVFTPTGTTLVPPRTNRHDRREHGEHEIAGAAEHERHGDTHEHG